MIENYIVNYPLYVFWGTLPSLIWLNFYLRKDSHPEPKPMVLKIFFFGMLITVPAIFLETVIFRRFGKLNFSSFTISILNIFLGVALVEEFLKFLVVKWRVFDNPELNEPVDTMLYMIISALGFAAGENLLIFFPLKSIFLSQIVGVSLIRFLGATFLHALSSAIVGFFIGLSFFRKKERIKLISFGLFLAILLHGLYNFSIMEIEGNLRILISFFLLLSSAIFVSFGFKKLKK